MKNLSVRAIRLHTISIIVPILLLLTFDVSAQVSPVEPFPEGDVEVLHVQGNVWLIAGAGGNIAVQAGDQGLLIVDTGDSRFEQAILTAIQSISDQPIRYIINTSMAEQHVGGNAILAPLPGGQTDGQGQGSRINVIAQENLLFGMSVARNEAGEQVFPQEAWPTDGYYEPQRSFTFNSEAIDIIHMPNAHTSGDSVVYFRGSNVLVSGDIYTTETFPLINYELGGTFTGSIAALDRMLDITVPDNLMEGGTYIIPGHGFISDEADLVEYRDMTYIIRDRLDQLIVEENLSLEQVKAARPLLGWEAYYNQPGWTVDMFIEAVFNEFSFLN